MSKSIKILISSLLCCFTFVLVSCVGSSSLTYWIDKNVTAVELISYNNPEVKNNPSEKYGLDLEKVEVLESLDLDSAAFTDFSREINIRVHMKMNRKQFLFSHDGKELPMKMVVFK